MSQVRRHPGAGHIVLAAVRALLAVALGQPSSLIAASAPLASPAPPPRYVSRIWRAQDGLPENRIRAIAQTPDGYLWVGTPGGLARFDGARFVVYSRFNTPSMTDENIRSLAVAKDGSLWIGTDGGGALHYRDGTFRAWGPADGLANEFVGSILEDRRGDIWAATNRGLYRMHRDRFQRVDESLRLPNIAFFALGQRRDGEVLAGGPGGLFQAGDFGGRATLAHFPPPGEPDEQVYSIRESADGALLLSTNHGLRRIGSGSPAIAIPQTKAYIGAIEQDHRGDLWFGTLGDGLLLLRDGQETAFRAPSALPSDSVSALLEDREHNIWAGTADGLVRLTAPVVEVLNNRNGLADDNVTTIYRDPRGILWLTTATGRIIRCTDGQPEEVHLPSPATGLRFRGTFEDHNGALWFGTDNQGVVRMENGRATRFSTLNGLRNNGVEAFFEDRAGYLWIGTTSGLSRWDGTRFRSFYLEDGLSYGWIRTIVADTNGDMLVGTDRGLNRFHDGRFVRDKAFGQLSHDHVWSIWPDSTGAIWIGTRGAGLVRVRQGQISRITTQEGLTSNSVFHLIADNLGKLWMSGPLGVSSVSLARLNAVADRKSPSLDAVSYGIGDGLESAQINGGHQPAGATAANGELWFPGVRGAVHFRPDLPRQAFRAPVRIESVTVDGQPVAVSGQITIGPGRHRIGIDFTACVLRAPERVTFRYILEGLDGPWRSASMHRTAEFDNLPPGPYRFRVASGEGRSEGGPPDGAVSEASFGLIVRPYFYQTVWFYFSVFSVACLCVVVVIRLKERQAQARYHLLLTERTRIAREMHDTVVQGCVGVSTLIEAAAGFALSDRGLMLECLDNARIHLRLTLDEARQALTDLRHDSFEHGLSGALSEMTRAFALDRGIPVTVEITGPETDLPEAMNRTLLLVAREAVRNAIVHGSPTLVVVRLTFDSTGVRLEIRDDGRGFETPPDRLSAAGHFGILGMRERMDQIFGTLEVSSHPGAGVTVAAFLPRKSVIEKMEHPIHG
ncbi:MAG TPA: two-component regulator propeller domain-containing protein [Bryobacteraceae bacterium]|nr:two-component regulator propeller domain-containing protein [Bryobacteraceae bacterium]